MISFQKSGGKLAGTRFELGESSEPVKKKRRVGTTIARPTLMQQFRGADVSKISKACRSCQLSLFKLMFCYEMIMCDLLCVGIYKNVSVWLTACTYLGFDLICINVDGHKMLCFGIIVCVYRMYRSEQEFASDCLYLLADI